MSTVLVTVVGPAGRRDLSLPADSPIHELMPTLVRLVGDSDGEASEAWALNRSPADDQPLSPGASLSGSGILDGAVLYLDRARAPEPQATPAAPLTGDGLTPAERTARILPPRQSTARRLGQAIRALFRSSPPEPETAQGNGDRGLSPFEAPPAPATFTVATKLGPTERARRAWRATDYMEQLDLAIVAPRLRRCVTVAVVSPKGGVGKTTVTALVGTLLALLRRDRVVAIDTNPDYGSLGRVLTPDHGLFVDDLLARVDEPNLTLTGIDAQLGRAVHGLMVLPAPTDPARMWRLDETAYRKVIERLQEFAGILLLDCGTGLQEPAAGAAIKSSDQLILVSDAEPAAASLVAEAGSLLARSGRPITLVVNKMPTRGSLLDLEQFGRHLPEASGQVVIPADVAEANRLTAGQFGWRDAPDPWRRSVRELAASLVAEWPALGLTLRPGSSARPPA